ncbi:MAG: flagellar hook protein FlgE [Lachnospiraceae bacterium]|nr:flagellar hook protein FlgE [Lachnospiraceae bacterium]
MMRALYSGVSGLKTHQVKMDVIGNNIANVNTTAYKSQSVTFTELMYQTTQSASGPNAATGTAGRNAKQIGLGSMSGAITTAITSPGSSQTTGNPFDLKITGDSFFIVSNGKDNFFTRDGSFYVDAAGNLATTATGYNVMGWGVDPETGNIKQDTVKPLKIMSPENMTYPPEATTKAYVTGILDKNDTNAASTSGKSISVSFFDSLGYSYTAKFAIKATDTEGEYNVELTDILNSNNESLKDVYKVGSIYNIAKFGDPANPYKLIFDTATGEFKSINGENSAILDFAESATSGSDTIDLKHFKDMSIDFSKTSMFNNNGTSTITMINGDETGDGSGRRIGELSGVSIQNNGMIYASYDNGQTRLLGQIAVASFANASGLQKEGDNLYSATLNSGTFDGIGVDVTTGGGYMSTGVLEMSNVDLSAEFTEMITTQRGFQANSRIITVSDTLLEELVNLKR